MIWAAWREVKEDGLLTMKARKPAVKSGSGRFSSDGPEEGEKDGGRLVCRSSLNLLPPGM